MKNTLASSGRRVRTYNKSPRLNLESKTKPDHLFDLRPYSMPIRPLRCSRTRRHPRLANPSVSEVTFRNADPRVSLYTTDQGKPSKEDNAIVSTKTQSIYRTHITEGCQWIEYKVMLSKRYAYQISCICPLNSPSSDPFINVKF